MEGLYTIEEFNQEGQAITAVAKLDPGHEVFDGHFPGHPVLPGVCAIQMVKDLVEKATGRELFMEAASNVKFTAIINPEEHDVITFQIQMEEGPDKVRVKNSVSFAETEALKLNLVFRFVD